MEEDDAVRGAEMRGSGARHAERYILYFAKGKARIAAEIRSPFSGNMLTCNDQYFSGIAAAESPHRFIGTWAGGVTSVLSFPSPTSSVISLAPFYTSLQLIC